MLRLPAQLDWGCRRGFDMEGDQLDDINTNQEAQEDQVTRKKFLMVGTILIGGKYKKKVNLYLVVLRLHNNLVPPVATRLLHFLRSITNFKGLRNMRNACQTYMLVVQSLRNRGEQDYTESVCKT
ncbi:hypothetical protein F2Q70_00009107 [Brassica cretica]|uniref:Uncharacterized protein n=1 Tax=Brassica cretica TaxID=69181 RepID=A0A8S9LXA8_BRACR|nr:hypothetical protein F2Q70_00009107 [Brassica cretica]